MNGFVVPLKGFWVAVGAGVATWPWEGFVVGEAVCEIYSIATKKSKTTKSPPNISNAPEGFPILFYDEASQAKCQDLKKGSQEKLQTLFWFV